MDNKPNILWVMTDQHNANCMGNAGHPNVKTPALDSLAQGGIKFDNAFCNNPICSPSRLSFVTGQYPHMHGFLGNNNFNYSGTNPDSIGAVFRRNCYQTAIIGKSHMIGAWDEEAFEHIRYCDLCDGDRNDPLKHHYFRYLVDNGLGDMYEEGNLPPEHQNSREGYAISELPYEHSIEHWTGNETLSFIENRDKSRPFLLQMSFQRPHPPLIPSAEHAALYNPEEIVLPENAVDAFENSFESKPEFIKKAMLRRRKDPESLKKVLAHYFALITAIDSEIGRVLEKLKQIGQLDNTIVIYTADHGDFAGEHGISNKNIGIYESIHRIPFIIRYPGGPEGTIRHEIMESVDLYPTLCELAGVPAPDGFDGESIIPIINGESGGKKQAIAEWDFPLPRERVNAIRTKQHRMVYYGRKLGGELYDREKDPGEINNVWNSPEYQQVRMELMERLFESINRYSLKTSFNTDRQEDQNTRNTPTMLLHKRGKKWSEVEALCYENTKK